MPQGKQRSGRLIIPNVRQGEEDPIDPSSFANSNRFDLIANKPKKSNMKRVIIPFALAIGASSSVSAFAPSRKAEVSLSPIRSGKCGREM